jgi:hypothetical protein
VTHGRCAVCGGRHAKCEFRAGSLECTNGETCPNPHHQRSAAIGLCGYCGGRIGRGDLVAAVAGKRMHHQCADRG